MVEPYQFEPIASSDSSLQANTEVDNDDSGDKPIRLSITGWQEFAHSTRIIPCIRIT